MAQHVWSVLCKRTLVDSGPSASLTLLDVLDVISVRKSTPDEDLTKAISLNFDCKLVSTWIRSKPEEPEDTVARLGLVLPDGSRASYSDPIRIDLREFPRARLTVNINVLPFKGPGTYRFVVELRTPTKWEEVAQLPLEATIDPSEMPKPTT